MTGLPRFSSSSKLSQMTAKHVRAAFDADKTAMRLHAVLEAANRLASISQLTEKDVEELADKADAGMAKR